MIKIGSLTARNGKDGISVPFGSTLSVAIGSADFQDTQRVLVERSPLEDLAEAGLRRDVNVEQLLMALRGLQSVPTDSKQTERALDKAGVGSWLSHGASLATIAQLVTDWHAKGILGAAIKALGG